MLKSKRGFTLVEIIAVMAISAILVGMAGSSYMDFKRNQALSNAAAQLTLDLQYVRELSLKCESAARVDIYANEYTIYPPSNYRLASPKNVRVSAEFEGTQLTTNAGVVPASFTVIPGGSFSLNGVDPSVFRVYTSYEPGSGASPPQGRHRTIVVDNTGTVRGLGDF